MTGIEKDRFIALVGHTLANNPTLLRVTIEAATEGVMAFASNQKDNSHSSATKLFELLETIEVPRGGLKLPHFTINEVIDEIEIYYYGTPALSKLKEKFGVKE